MKKINIKKSSPYRGMGLKHIFTGIALLTCLGSFAQEAKPVVTQETLWLFSNGLFNTLLGVIVLLLIIISVLGGVLKNVARFSSDRKRNTGGTAAGIIAFIVLISSSQKSVAQTTAAVASTGSNYMGLGAGMFFLMIALIVLELIIIAVLIGMIQMFVKKEMAAAAYVAAKKAEPTFMDRISAAVPVEKEADIMLDHNYDGIRELDNDLPPWWKYGFYVTIIFAVVYLVNHHITKTSDLQIAMYEKSMEEGRIAKEEFQKKDANNVTENTVKLYTDKTHLDEAFSLFKDNCAVCHGKLGEGGVGPNLTDVYWIHGGSLKDIFHTITNGWPDKGMKSWQADFSPLKIDELASYIKSLSGTNPPNGKAPQGDVYKEEGAVVSSDSTKTDSTKVIAPAIDSVKVGKKK